MSETRNEFPTPPICPGTRISISFCAGSERPATAGTAGKNDGGQKSHNRCATVHRLVCSGIIGCRRCCNGKHHGAGFGRCIGLGDGGIDCFNRCVCQRDGQLGPCADKACLGGHLRCRYAHVLRSEGNSRYGLSVCNEGNGVADGRVDRLDRHIASVQRIGVPRGSVACLFGNGGNIPVDNAFFKGELSDRFPVCLEGDRGERVQQLERGTGNPPLLVVCHNVRLVSVGAKQNNGRSKLETSQPIILVGGRAQSHAILGQDVPSHGHSVTAGKIKVASAFSPACFS